MADDQSSNSGNKGEVKVERPAPTGNPGTRSDDKANVIRKAPTGNYGSFNDPNPGRQT
jgi:hypothetical protein